MVKPGLRETSVFAIHWGKVKKTGRKLESCCWRHTGHKVLTQIPANWLVTRWSGAHKTPVQPVSLIPSEWNPNCGRLTFWLMIVTTTGPHSRRRRNCKSVSNQDQAMPSISFTSHKDNMLLGQTTCPTLLFSPQTTGVLDLTTGMSCMKWSPKNASRQNLLRKNVETVVKCSVSLRSHPQSWEASQWGQPCSPMNGIQRRGRKPLTFSPWTENLELNQWSFVLY